MIKEILLALLGSQAVLFTLQWAKEAWHRKKKKSDARLQQLLEHRLSIKNILRELLLKTRAQRTLVVKVANGGGTPSPTSVLYLEMLYEDNEQPLLNIAALYGRRRIDRDYIDLCIRLIKEKRIHLHTEKLNVPLIREAYQAEGIKFSELNYLYRDENAMYFLSMSTTIDIETYSKEEQREINRAVTELAFHLRH